MIDHLWLRLLFIFLFVLFNDLLFVYSYLDPRTKGLKKQEIPYSLGTRLAIDGYIAVAVSLVIFSLK